MFKVVADALSLQEGDKIIIVSLNTGKTEENVTVTSVAGKFFNWSRNGTNRPWQALTRPEEYVLLLKNRMPEFWPPQTGDIWEKGKEKYFITESAAVSTSYRKSNGGYGALTLEKFVYNAEKEPQSVSLVYREEVAG